MSDLPPLDNSPDVILMKYGDIDIMYRKYGGDYDLLLEDAITHIHQVLNGSRYGGVATELGRALVKRAKELGVEPRRFGDGSERA